jgi:hypothetical protein
MRSINQFGLLDSPDCAISRSASTNTMLYRVAVRYGAITQIGKHYSGRGRDKAHQQNSA